MQSYEEKLAAEMRTFKGVTKVHDLPAIQAYWAKKYLRPKMLEMGYDNINDFFVKQIAVLHERLGRPLRILSIGSGNCDFEVRLVKALVSRRVPLIGISCLELNPDMLDRGRGHAADAGLGNLFSFQQADLNAWSCNDHCADVVVAVQCLHHVVNLEGLFENVRRCLPPDGLFLINDTVGRNGHTKWPEALQIIKAIWAALPDQYKRDRHNGQVLKVFPNLDCSSAGFEGIRAQDILPLLVQTFHFETFIGYQSIVQPFIGRRFGHNFDPDSSVDCALIDLIAGMDEHYLDIGTVKPTQMTAALHVTPVVQPRFWGTRSPDRCLRLP
jgi:SAM-dependent methyltransferase